MNINDNWSGHGYPEIEECLRKEINDLKEQIKYLKSKIK